MQDHSNELGNVDIDRMDRIQSVVDAFLLQRAGNPDASVQRLMEEHRELMPELGEFLRQVQRIDAARKDAVKTDQTVLDTDAYHGPATTIPGLFVRCPYCFLQIRVGTEDQLEKIDCAACGNSFCIVDRESGPSTPDPIGNFEFIERLGSGSFGTVWKARDTHLERLVAIKVPRQGKLDGREVEQFIREARVAAQLNHAGIVKVYEVGRNGDTVYIVSDLVEGIPLSRWIPTSGVSCQEAAELCMSICDALHHAHEEGVVHRDLKPANILLDELATPYVTDFGLAKRHANDVTITADGHILGTPAYMSPEQASGSYNLDRRSDIYSVGVILFELLTGERPFRGDVSRLIDHVVHDDPPRPRDLRKSVPRDVETICLKCLEKEPDRRYQTAQDLADDLRRWSEHLPIHARPISRLERMRRWCIRHPISAAIVITALATLLLTILAWVSVDRTRRIGLETAVSELNDYRQRDSTELQSLKDRVMDAVAKLKDLDINDSDQCQMVIDDIYKEHDRSSAFGPHPFASWYLLDIDGENLAVYPHGLAVGRDFHERDYFTGAMQNFGKVYASEPFRSANDGLYKFALAYAVTDNHKTPQCVLAASVATDSTRAIQREEILMRQMVRWTVIALVPNAFLAIFLTVHALWRTTKRLRKHKELPNVQMDAPTIA